MRVLLINPHYPLSSRVPATPLGLLSIASYLQAEGHTVKIVDRALKVMSIEKQLISFKPDVVGISLISARPGSDAIKISKFMQKRGVPVVWGGHMPSIVPELVFREKCVDYVVVGEGEYTWLELLEAIDGKRELDSVLGLAYEKDGAVCFTGEREFIKLADLPELDWTLIEPEKYFQSYFLCNKMLYVYAAKGCPAGCTFCVNPVFHKSKYRTRPPAHVVRDIEYLVKNCGLDGVNFSDELWYIRREEIYEFLGLLNEKKLDFVWGCQMRVGILQKEDLQAMYDAGCRWMLIGVESGCPERLKKIRKGIDLDGAKKMMADCREVGITTQASFMIGYPDETADEIRQTINACREINPNFSPFNILYPSPKTVIYEDAMARGVYKGPQTIREWSKVEFGDEIPANLSAVPNIDLLVVHYHFQWVAFFDKSSVSSDSYGIFKKISSDAINKVFKHGLLLFFAGAYISVKQFFTVLWYAKCHPKVLKKYGLK